MAGNHLNLPAVIKFSAVGIREAKRQLDSLYGSIRGMAGALGASLGLAGFISQLKETATQLSVARATLKNTSDDIVQYGQNMEFVERLAKNYKQDIIGLTEGFAKFHAASKGTNVGLEEQKKIFESLTRAATYYHMSADRTNNMLIAVEQMMSKGKITAEELRRQLGNNLPGAFNMMARAAGMSMAEFESAMKKGQIGVETLIKFADELNKTTENIDLDSLQLSMNEMKNAWTNFTESSDFESVLKRVYDLVTSILNFATGHIKDTIRLAGSLAAGVIAGKLIPAVVKLAKAMREVTAAGWVGALATGLTLVVSKLISVKKEADAAAKALGKMKGLSADISDEEKIQIAMDTKAAAEQWIKANGEKYLKIHSKVPWAEQTLADYKSGKKTLNEDNPANDYIAAQNIVTNEILQTYRDNEQAIIEANKTIVEARLAIEKRQKEEKKSPENNNQPDGKPKGKKPKTVEDYLKDYRDGTKKLNNQLNAGSKTTEEAVDEGNKLAKETWENITAFDNFREAISKLSPELQNAAQQAEYFFGVAKETENIRNTEKQEKADEKDNKKWQDFLKDIAAEQSDFKARDTRQDYKKKDYEIIREEQEQWEKISEDLQDRVNKIKSEFDTTNVEIAEKLNELNNALETAKTHVTNLKDAADVAEWQNDIKELTKAYYEGLAGGIKSIATSLDRVTSGWKTLKRTMEDEDSTGWEKFIAALSEIIQLFDTLNGLYETYNILQKAGQALSRAHNAEELKGISEVIAGRTAENIVKGENLALTEAATVAEGAEAAASVAATSAKSGEAIADATKSGAKLPFPANIAAIAAGVAAVVGALALVGSFANGGIVGGNSKHGDKLLARVNSGEQIINPQQQKRLWNMISGKESPNVIGNVGKVEFELRGDKLLGCIKNYEKLRRG